MIKDELARIVAGALDACRASGALALPNGDAGWPPIGIEPPHNPAHGDYAVNVALALAKTLRRPPREVAEIIVACLPTGGANLVQAVSVADAGFINLRLAPGFWGETLRGIVRAGESWGRSNEGRGRRVLLEFVSANPHGPITVQHGRGGVIGDALAALYAAAGWQAEREFYVNDATNALQMRVFARSVLARYHQLLGRDDPVPDDGYSSEYVFDVARDILAEAGDRYADLPNAQVLSFFQDRAARLMRAQQESALAAFGVRFDNWYSETALYQSGAVEKVLAALKNAGHAYEQGGALWLRSTSFGDDQDRVLARVDGSPTYIAGDLAYHAEKFARGFDALVNVFGGDHAGYVARTQAGLAALGKNPARLHIVVYQLVRLIQEGQETRLSKPAGSVATLAELVNEVGRDAARFFFLLHAPNAPLDFDLDLARRAEKENPLFYAHYAHARCCAILETAGATDVPFSDPEAADLTLLNDADEIALIKRLADFPDEVREAANALSPHRVAHYVLEVAAKFHAYHDRGNHDPALRLIRPDEPAVTAARLILTQAVRLTLANAFALLGINAPKRMTRENGDADEPLFGNNDDAFPHLATTPDDAA